MVGLTLFSFNKLWANRIQAQSLVDEPDRVETETYVSSSRMRFEDYRDPIRITAKGQDSCVARGLQSLHLAVFAGAPADPFLERVGEDERIDVANSFGDRFDLGIGGGEEFGGFSHA